VSHSNRWKYLVVRLKPTFIAVKQETLQAELDRQGALGWELVSLRLQSPGLELVFKRPI
jgi:hypothetical protein